RFLETETLPEIFLNHMRDNFRVCSGDEPVPFGLKLAVEVQIVFYDTIMDDSDSGFAVNQRVRVFLDRAAVCCPAGVSNSYRSGQEVEVVFGVDLVESSTILLNCEGSVCYGYFTDGVVSPIF